MPKINPKLFMKLTTSLNYNQVNLMIIDDF